jgi:hypothetical protein
VEKTLVKPPSEARQVARWLLRSSLPPELCDGVDEDHLTALIAGSGLLRHGWTRQDVLDELLGAPEHAHLPRWVRTPRAWVTTRIREAVPHLPPSKRRLIRDVERGSRWFTENRQRARDAEIAVRRGAIDACSLCDHNGILDLGGDAPLTRCTHDPDTGGW